MNNNHHSRRGNIPFRQISSRRGLLSNNGNDDQRQGTLLHNRGNLPRQTQSKRGKKVIPVMEALQKETEKKEKIPKKGGNPNGNPQNLKYQNDPWKRVRNKENGLTIKRLRFVEEYMKDYNGAQAAIRAGYSKKTGAQAASVLLSIPKVKEIVEKRQREMAVKLELDRESILDRYKCLMDYRITDFFNDDGSLKPLSEIPVRSLYAIQGFKHNTRVSVNQDDHRQQSQDLIREFNLPVKQNVLDSVVKMLGLNKEEKHEYSGKLELVLPESVDRVAEVLGILLGSGLVQRRLAEYSQGELSGDQQAIDAEAE